MEALLDFLALGPQAVTGRLENAQPPALYMGTEPDTAAMSEVDGCPLVIGLLIRLRM